MSSTPNIRHKWLRQAAHVLAFTLLTIAMACGGTEENGENGGDNVGNNGKGSSNTSNNGSGGGKINSGTGSNEGPRWIFDRAWDQESGYIYGVGIGEGEKGQAEATKNAEAAARADISSQIEVTVEAEFDRRVSEVMIDDRSSVTNQSRQKITSQSRAALRDTEVVSTWENPRSGDVYARVRAPEAVRAEAAEAIHREWQKDDTLVYASANYEYNRNNYSAAIEMLETITSRNPGHQQAQLLLGQSKLAMGEGEEALNLFDLVVGIKSDTTEAFIASRLARKLREDLGKNVNIDPMERLLRDLAAPDTSGMIRQQALQQYFKLLAESIVVQYSPKLSSVRGTLVLLNQIQDSIVAGMIRDFLIPSLESLFARRNFDIVAGSTLYAQLRERGITKVWEADPIAIARNAGASNVITITGEQLAIVRAVRVRDSRMHGEPMQFLVPNKDSSAQGGSPIMMVAGVAAKGEAPGWRLVDWGQDLVDANEARVNFRIDRRAFVYALVYSASESEDRNRPASRFRILYPNKNGSALVQAHQAFSLPAGESFQLPEGEWIERIFVIASQEPIKEFDDAFAKQSDGGLIAGDSQVGVDLAGEVIKRFKIAKSSVFDYKRVATQGSTEGSPAALTQDIVEGFGSVAYYIRFTHD